MEVFIKSALPILVIGLWWLLYSVVIVPGWRWLWVNYKPNRAVAIDALSSLAATLMVLWLFYIMTAEGEVLNQRLLAMLLLQIVILVVLRRFFGAVLGFFAGSFRDGASLNQKLFSDNNLSVALLMVMLNIWLLTAIAVETSISNTVASFYPTSIGSAAALATFAMVILTSCIGLKLRNILKEIANGSLAAGLSLMWLTLTVQIMWAVGVGITGSYVDSSCDSFADCFSSSPFIAATWDMKELVVAIIIFRLILHMLLAVVLVSTLSAKGITWKQAVDNIYEKKTWGLIEGFLTFALVFSILVRAAYGF